MTKDSTPQLTPLIPSIADALAAKDQDRLAARDCDLKEIAAICADIPTAIAEALREGSGFAVVMDLIYKRDWVYPGWAQAIAKGKPEAEWLKTRAKGVYDYCVLHGLQPFFSRGRNAQMAVNVNDVYINMLLSDYQKGLGGGEDIAGSKTPIGPVDIEALVKMSANRRDEKARERAASLAAEEGAAYLRSVAEAEETMVTVSSLLTSAARAGADYCKIMHIHQVEIPSCRPGERVEPGTIIPSKGTSGRMVWDRLISEMKLNPVVGMVQVRCEHEPSFPGWGILIPLRSDFVPVVNGMVGPQ